MYNKSDILARLLAGEEADSIAQEMADALNAAKEEKTKRDEAAKAEAIKNACKVEAMRQILGGVGDYFANFVDGSAELVEKLQKMEDKDIESICKSMEVTYKNINGMKHFEFKLPSKNLLDAFLF